MICISTMKTYDWYFNDKTYNNDISMIKFIIYSPIIKFIMTINIHKTYDWYFYQLNVYFSTKNYNTDISMNESEIYSSVSKFMIHVSIILIYNNNFQ